MTTTNKLGIYIHVPFCKSKCLYCGFYSSGGELTPEAEAEYADGIIEDIIEYGKRYGKLTEAYGFNDDTCICESNDIDDKILESQNQRKNYLVDSVFIGGGTPSVLSSSTVEKILDCLRESFDIADDCEITIETNPGTLTGEKLCSYKRAGINRLSMGVQSLDNGILRRLGRIHTAEEFEKNFKQARAAGFDNINLDFMFSVPGHTMEIWEDTLRRAIRLGPEHISFYSLQLEEGTPFFEMFRRGEIEEVPDELDRDMYHRAIEFFKEAGYMHYEISNCAKPGFECRHNLKYWSMDEYIGIGPTASSYIEGARFTEGPYPEFHVNTLEDDMSEFVFTGLRKAEGISLTEFSEKYGQKFWDVYARCQTELKPYFDRGLLIYDKEMNRLRLGEYGIDISNGIMSVFV